MSIFFNNSSINDWYFADDNIVKVYHNNAVCYYKVSGESPTPEYKFQATYTGGTTYSAECDSTSAITNGEIAKTDLESVVIGDCVTSIGQYAFQNCTSLTSIDIPNGVISIGAQAFYYCSSLSSVTIPSGVTSIGSTAFRFCTSLTSITVNAITPPALGNYIFHNTNNCPIYVPLESVETYKAASGWSDYASRIQAIP